MQDKFLKSLIYTILGILLAMFLMIQPYNIYCKVSKNCHPVTLSSLKISKKGKKEITLNFSSEIEDNIKNYVTFYPEKQAIKKFSNQIVKNSYIVKNLSNNKITVQSHYQAKPELADKFLNRIECLCFQSETLKSGEEIKMPLKFQIKKEIENAEELEEININYKIFIL